MPAAKLFVGGVPFRATEEEIREHFSQAGEVEEVFIPLDKETRRPRGFVFVTMADEAGANKAIEMFNEQDFGGRTIKVNMALPKEERPRDRM